MKTLLFTAFVCLLTLPGFSQTFFEEGTTNPFLDPNDRAWRFGSTSIGTDDNDAYVHVQNGSPVDVQSFVRDSSDTPIDSTNIAMAVTCNTGSGINAGLAILSRGNSSQNYGGGAEANGNNSQNVGFIAAGVGDSSTCIGFFGRSEGDGGDFGAAGIFEASGENRNLNAGLFAQGVGNNNGLNAGVFAQARGTGNGSDFAVMAEVDTPGTAGFFNGDVLSTTGNFVSSDARLKTNVKDYLEGLELIGKINVKKYRYNRSEFPTLNLPGGQQAGVLAQELEEVYPVAVKEFTRPAIHKGEQAVTFKAVNYTALVPLLIRATQELGERTTENQELTAQIKDHENRIAELERELELIKASLQDKATGQDIISPTGSVKGATLFQNTPNPFSKNTRIQYHLPENTSSANLFVFDMSGTQILNRPLVDNGQGVVEIEGGSLKAGMYIYSLVVDGKEIDTKRMILTE